MPQCRSSGGDLPNGGAPACQMCKTHKIYYCPHKFLWKLETFYQRGIDSNKSANKKLRKCREGWDWKEYFVVSERPPTPATLRRLKSKDIQLGRLLHPLWPLQYMKQCANEKWRQTKITWLAKSTKLRNFFGWKINLYSNLQQHGVMYQNEPSICLFIRTKYPWDPIYMGPDICPSLILGVARTLLMFPSVNLAKIFKICKFYWKHRPLTEEFSRHKVRTAHVFFLKTIYLVTGRHIYYNWGSKSILNPQILKWSYWSTLNPSNDGPLTHLSQNILIEKALKHSISRRDLTFSRPPDPCSPLAPPLGHHKSSSYETFSNFNIFEMATCTTPDERPSPKPGSRGSSTCQHNLQLAQL